MILTKPLGAATEGKLNMQLEWRVLSMTHTVQLWCPHITAFGACKLDWQCVGQTSMPSFHTLWRRYMDYPAKKRTIDELACASSHHVPNRHIMFLTDTSCLTGSPATCKTPQASEPFAVAAVHTRQLACLHQEHKCHTVLGLRTQLPSG